MTYIILAAGKGTRLNPLTLHMPKSMYRLDDRHTVLHRMTELLRTHDMHSEIVVVTGFQHKKIQENIKGVVFVNNPFYEVTNSIASLWFAREYLDRENVTIINGDVVVDRRCIREIVCKKNDKPFVCIDSSIKGEGDYNVEVKNGQILVMSKNLKSCYGEYAGITKLERASSRRLKEYICMMVERGEYDQWYENALVQMIFDENFGLYYEDIKGYRWTEIDDVDDFIVAEQIHMDEMND